MADIEDKAWDLLIDKIDGIDKKIDGNAEIMLDHNTRLNEGTKAFQEVRGSIMSLEKESVTQDQFRPVKADYTKRVAFKVAIKKWAVRFTTAIAVSIIVLYITRMLI